MQFDVRRTAKADRANNIFQTASCSDGLRKPVKLERSAWIRRTKFLRPIRQRKHVEDGLRQRYSVTRGVPFGNQRGGRGDIAAVRQKAAFRILSETIDRQWSSLIMPHRRMQVLRIERCLHCPLTRRQDGSRQSSQIVANKKIGRL